MNLRTKLRSVIPHPALRMVKTFRANARLSKLERKAFDAVPLRRFTQRDLQSIFSNTAIESAWKADAEPVRMALPNTKGGSTDLGERRAIYYLCASLKPSSVLEVGTNLGSSTVMIAQALATHVGPDARLVTLDIYDVNRPREGRTAPREALKKLGLSDKVDFQINAALSYFDSVDTKFDLIFLDGDHSASAVYLEISAALRHLKEGGIILLHDYHPQNRHVFRTGDPIPGPYLGVKRIRSEGNPIDVLPFGELPWPTRGGNEKASCLAMLTRV